jgi:hypothetical protein
MRVWGLVAEMHTSRGLFCLGEPRECDLGPADKFTEECLGRGQRRIRRHVVAAAGISQRVEVRARPYRNAEALHREVGGDIPRLAYGSLAHRLLRW